MGSNFGKLFPSCLLFLQDQVSDTVNLLYHIPNHLHLLDSIQWRYWRACWGTRMMP